MGRPEGYGGVNGRGRKITRESGTGGTVTGKDHGGDRKRVGVEDPHEMSEVKGECRRRDRRKRRLESWEVRLMEGRRGSSRW